MNNVWFQDGKPIGYKVQLACLIKDQENRLQVSDLPVRWVDTDIYGNTMQEVVLLANSRFPNIKYRVVPSRKV